MNQNQPVMRSALISRVFIFLILFYLNESSMAQGFYKDIFLDGGIALGYFEIPAIKSLALTMEFLNTDDSAQQRRILISNKNDENGVLLYPDGEPRFRLLYTFGGSSGHHGYSLSPDGIQIIRDYYFNGGSYSGSCAGSAIFSSGKDQETIDVYYQLWPGFVHQFDNGQWLFLDHFIPRSSPLLRYRYFGDDFRIEKIRYGGGNYAIQDERMPEQTETLLYYDCPEYEIDNHISCWAYKASRMSGRGVVIGSHPEWCENEEGQKLIEAIFLYALDGVGAINLKGTLENGIPRNMNRDTRDKDPAFSKIGDKQYHHFIVSIPNEVDRLIITLDGQDGYPFNLYANYNSYAYAGHALFSSTEMASDKSITITPAKAGIWYIGVECAATIIAEEAEFGYEYSGDLEVLNGLEYSLTADWETQQRLPQDKILFQNYPNPFNLKTEIIFGLPDRSSVLIRIYSLKGELVEEIVNGTRESGFYHLVWDASGYSSGTYIIMMQAGDFFQIQKCVLLK